MIIKPTQKRLEFEKLLRDLGYKDRSPVLPQNNKRRQQVNYMLPSGAMAVYTFIIPYFNKKSYLYLEFEDNYHRDNLKEKIKTLAKRIYFKEKTMICEVGWEVTYTKQPDQFGFDERKKVLFDFIKNTYTNLNQGMFGLTPHPGIILVAKPYGPKLNEGFTHSSIELGTHQRALVARKFGFGKMLDDGFCYARYDDNLILQPI